MPLFDYWDYQEFDARSKCVDFRSNTSVQIEGVWLRL